MRLNMLAPAAFVLGLVGLDQAVASGSSAWFFYNRGRVETRVEGAEALSARHYPAGLEHLTLSDEGYLQVGMDRLGRFAWRQVARIYDDAAIEPGRYGRDEATFNFKGGAFNSPGPGTLVGYGFDIDARSNDYRQAPGDSLTRARTLIGLGPNVAVRIQPNAALTLFPNVSGFWYPWPNEDASFLPKSLGYGYRAELPVMVDVVRLLTPEARRSVTVSALFFIGSKSGFYKTLGGRARDADASVRGIKFGASWDLGVVK